MNHIDYISQLNMEELPDIKLDNSDLASFTDLSFFDFDSASFNAESELSNIKLNFQHQVEQQINNSSESPLPQQHFHTNDLINFNEPVKQEPTFTFSIPQAVTPMTTMSSPEFDHSTESDKKKRNTAASARFRIKKKLREQEMERNLKNLKERIEGYNLRIQELELENKCLKSLIIEKNEQKSNDLLKSIRLKSINDDATL